ncbi:MAG: DEAD/DEAH box helicase family protein [Thermoproteota archaeon]|nr:DEAD/DEAH box helicase family protein [Thermoproteota archaeon]
MSNPFIKNSDANAGLTKTDLPHSSQTFVPSISLLQFPFTLKKDQIDAVEAWLNNNYRGTILYSTGTGKTEIAFECARRLANYRLSSSIDVSNEDINSQTEYTLSLHTPTSFTVKSTKLKDALINQNNYPANNKLYCSLFNILFLVPRISLIDQTIKRLVFYGVPEEKVGAYFGERKEIREIIISTYHSVVRNLEIVRRSHMVIFDEVHLISESAKSFSKIFDTVVEDPNKAILGLTATLDEFDFKNRTILTVLPPIKRYSIRKAVGDKRLAKPVVIPIKVNLLEKESKEYDVFSTKIKNISNRFKRYDANSMTLLLKKGGFASGMAKAWFSNIRKRRLLLSYSENKLIAAADIISKKFPDEKIMVFSETIESIEKLKVILEIRGIKAKIIDAKVKTSERQKILDKWGNDFNVLLSIHTLEIGYDVPQVRIEIIMATTSNINQVIQRIGRVLRKHEGKDVALIYVIYVSDTKDDKVIEVVKKAIKNDSNTGNQIDIEEEESESGKITEKQVSNIRDIKSKEKKKEENKIAEKEGVERRVERAYRIVESSLKGSFIVEQKEEDKEEENIDSVNNNILNTKRKTKIYIIKSSKDNNKFYQVNVEDKTCTCSDFIFRQVKCKHIIATEFVLP